MTTPPRPGPDPHSVELAPRPHTIPPNDVQMLELSSEEVEAMSEEQLVWWAQNYLGVTIDPAWPKTRMIDELVRCSVSAN